MVVPSLVIGIVWALVGIGGAVMRGRRAPSERMGQGVLISVALILAMGLYSWPDAAAAVLLVVGLQAAWRRAVRPWVLVYGAGVSLGALLYWGGTEALAGAVCGGVLVVMRNVLQARFGARAERGLRSLPVRPYKRHALLCNGRACQRQGSGLLWEAMRFSSAFHASNGMRTSRTHCLGACQRAPVLLLEPEGHLVSHVALTDLPRLALGDARHED